MLGTQRKPDLEIERPEKDRIEVRVVDAAKGDAQHAVCREILAAKVELDGAVLEIGALQPDYALMGPGIDVDDLSPPLMPEFGRAVVRSPSRRS